MTTIRWSESKIWLCIDTAVRSGTFHVPVSYIVARTISHSFASLTREILFLPLEHKSHIFEPTCNVLFIIWRLNIEYFRFIVFQSSQVLQIRLGFIKIGGNRDVIERYDIHKGDIRKIRHSGPG